MTLNASLSMARLLQHGDNSLQPTDKPLPAAHSPLSSASFCLGRR
jgi:hypothetical protein